jgi:ABC-type phosphate transport system substrate-binding protein
MRSLGFTLVLALLVLGLATPSATVADPKPARLMIVVHADNKVDRLERTTLRNIYLGRTTFWGNDLRVKPYNRVHDGAAGRLFFSDVLEMTPGHYRSIWQKLALSGQGVEPEIVGSAASLVAKVAASPGAIGYLLDSEADAADSRVRLLPL